MIKKTFVLLLLSLFLSGCFTHYHTIDSGFHTGEIETHHQWYIFFGLIPVGEDKDSGKLADADKFRIIEKYSWLDSLMNLTIPGFMGFGATRRTIIIQK